MLTAVIAIFVISYAAIAMEHPLKINKAAFALIGAGLLWTIYAVSTNDHHLVSEQLAESLIGIAQIVFFLMGAMTIVEVVDAHDGFDVITARIKTTKLTSLMWLIGVLTFFLSAILDNLTTTIVMVSLIQKLLDKHEDRLLFSGIIVIAANAGGAWSPIGDVTTTMLWIGGQVTSLNIIESLLLPSLVNLLVPLLITAYTLRGRMISNPSRQPEVDSNKNLSRNVMLFSGLGILVIVPAFKAVTHLPPFLGILFGLGILWLIADILHRNKDDEAKQHLTLANALGRIDLSSITFFVGILLSVAVLEHTNILTSLAGWLDKTVQRQDIIVMIIGIASSIVDNVPLVAASMGMYSLTDYPTDHLIWEFLAYSAGTGGSILIIGSAAGIAAMGLERINFGWYLKKISGLALIGYFSGAGVYLLQYSLTHGHF